VHDVANADDPKDGCPGQSVNTSYLTRPLSPLTFLTLMAICAVGLFGAVWTWVLTAPMTFLDPEYPSWHAKQILLANCDLGNVLILGDSRAAAAMMPIRWHVKALNLAVGGGEPIEALSALTRAARCPIQPARVILSFDAIHFTEPDLFWERTARFGFVDADEITSLRDVSRALGDLSVYELRHMDGLASSLRDVMYRVRFPTLYFSSLVKGGLLLRWPHNNSTLNASIVSRGQYFFGTTPGSDAIAAEGNMNDFRPLPVLTLYFNRILEQLEARGIPAVFVAVPMNTSTAHLVSPGVRLAFRLWLARFEARYPGFRVVGDVMPFWPDMYFGDGYSHLNPNGAATFSDILGACLDEKMLTEACVQRLQAAPPSTQNDAQYGWFNGTGRDASTNERPSSKRGS
jgi:hypothetical protein